MLGALQNDCRLLMMHLGAWQLPDEGLISTGRL